MEVTFVCLKWGSLYTSEHVNTLFAGIRRHFDEPFGFTCLTDDASGLDRGITAKPIPDMGLQPERWESGCWPKISVFKPGLFDDADLVMYLDLDLVILRSLTPFVERARALSGLHILQEWHPALWSIVPQTLRPDRGAQSSLFCWRPAEQHHVYARFMADKTSAYLLASNDQEFIGKVASGRRYWPHDWTVSFRRSCVWYFPLNLIFREIKKPKHARVVVFHGRPRPWDLISGSSHRWGTRRKFGFGPVSWVEQYWQANNLPPKSIP